MDFELTDDQKLLSDTVAQFAKQRSPLERMRKLRAHPIGWEKDMWRAMGELGWLSVPFPESQGGFGGSFAEVAVILEKLGTTLVPEPFLASVVLGGRAVSLLGSSSQVERFLAPMIEGKTSLAFAHGERENRYSIDAKTRAEKSGGGYAITGSKSWVLNGQAADHLIVTAALDGGLGLFAIDRDAPGLTIKSVQTMDGHKAAMIELANVKVDADRLLGTPDRGAAVVEAVLDGGAAGACAEGVGIIDTVLAMTSAYLKERKQFGVAIGSFQALQHRAVDMFVESQLCRSMMYVAAIRVSDDDVEARKRDVSAAKAQLSVGGRFVVQQAIQLHGGIGITDEHDVGLYFKRMSVLTTLFGDEAHHTTRFANLPSFTADLA
jgi:alkylation response protein AidB-like acyl-CoA dehydrogenase